MSHDATVSTFKDSEVMQNLRYCLIPGRYLGQDYRHLYIEIFKFWQAQWSNVFCEIGISFSPGSEEFCRHEEVSCLIYRDKIVACALLDYFDLSNPVQKKHLYFCHYPESVLEKIPQIANNKPVFTFEYLAVDPEFRKKYSLADIILGLAVRRMLESASSLLIAYTRNTRKINELSYRLGANAFVRNCMVRGEPADFVYFDKSNIQITLQKEVHQYMQRLWDNKIFIPSLNVL